MTTKRNPFEDAFKLEVAKMVVDQGLGVMTVAQQMNVGRTAVVGPINIKQNYWVKLG